MKRIDNITLPVRLYYNETLQLNVKRTCNYVIEQIMKRRDAVCRLVAEQALTLPLLPGGFWFHSDLRDNFYSATHLLAYCLDGAPAWEEAKRTAGEELAVTMLQRVLALQDQDANSPMYGHWPLNLGPNPAEAKPHPLPVELMGCLLILFYERYRAKLPLELKSEMSLAILHMYQSRVYRHPLAAMNHHEAKHTALKLLLGHQFADETLLEEGKRCAARLLEHLRKHGFKEYGALPWHWHWIQAFACAWEVVDDAAARDLAEELLGLLWDYRADYYLKGTWVGALSRHWPHDVPKDTNTLHDWVQFGDFGEPDRFPRVEGAGLLGYIVPAAVRERAVTRTEPCEVKRRIHFAGADGEVQAVSHTYAYVAPGFAVGGVWERREEFDNEQLRWEVSLPLTSAAAAQGVNRLYFFHPGKKYAAGDDRHASPYGEVLLHKDAVAQVWVLPKEDTEAANELIGVLPKGEWSFDETSGYGKLGAEAYVAFHLPSGFQNEVLDDRIRVKTALHDGQHAVVVEVWSAEEAAASGATELEGFRRMAELHKPIFTFDGDRCLVQYATKRGDQLELSLAGVPDLGEPKIPGGGAELTRKWNGKPLQLAEYCI
jgi:hypothetical protein